MPEARARRLLRALLLLAAVSSAAAAARAQTAETLPAKSEPSKPFVAANWPNFFDDRQGQTTTTQPQPQQQQGQSKHDKRRAELETPLTPGQKMKRSLRSAFLSPQAYLNTAFGATLTHFREEDQPHKDSGDRAADWASRFARNFSTRATRRIFSDGIYASAFGQDPRYEPSPRKGFARRAAHAASRVFITRDDDGNHEVNASGLAGNMTGSALANLWEQSTPGHDRIGVGPTFKRFGRSLAIGALTNVVFQEFWPDIMGIFKR